MQVNPSYDRKSSHSLDSSRVSNMSISLPTNLEVKRMQAKMLMDYYRQNEEQKQKKSVEKIVDKRSYGNYEKSQTQNYLMQQQAKRSRKQEVKQNLAAQYEQMIRQKQQRQKQIRQHQRQQQKRNFELMNKWGRDSKQDLIRKQQQKQQYGKQLEMHLRLQQIMKYQQKVRERQMIEKYQIQQDQKNRNYDRMQLENFKRKQMFERRQNAILGLSSINGSGQKMNFNSNPQKSQENNNYNNSNIKRMNDNYNSIDLESLNGLGNGGINRRVLKKREQMLYGSGLEQQLRSQTISPQPFDKYNSESLKKFNQGRIVPQSKSSFQNYHNNNNNSTEIYNPITNPIQINYKNPYILKMLVNYNN